MGGKEWPKSTIDCLHGMQLAGLEKKKRTSKKNSVQFPLMNTLEIFSFL